MPPEILQGLIAEAREQGWPYLPPRFFSREQLASMLQIKTNTLNRRLASIGVVQIPHWPDLVDIEKVVQLLSLGVSVDEQEVE